MKWRLSIILFLVFALGFSMWTALRTVHSYGISEKFARPLSSKLPKGLTSLTAKSCGECHQEIYKEWLTTNHSAAWSDLYFQIDWKWDKKNKIVSTATPPYQISSLNLWLDLMTPTTGTLF